MPELSRDRLKANRFLHKLVRPGKTTGKSWSELIRRLLGTWILLWNSAAWGPQLSCLQLLTTVPESMERPSYPDIVFSRTRRLSDLLKSILVMSTQPLQIQADRGSPASCIRWLRFSQLETASCWCCQWLSISICDTLKIKDFRAESALGINERGVCYKLVGRGCTGELKLLRLCDSGDGQMVGNQS